MYGYIYKTTNLVNNKIYIGQKKASKFLGTSYLGSGVVLRKAFRKYGYNAFIVELIEICDTKEELNIREKYWINKFNSKNIYIGYNIADGGEGNNGGGFKNHKHSISSKQKISASMSRYNQIYRKGKKMIDICGNTYINGMKGKPAKNKGLIKIYNKELNKVKYIQKDDTIENYPGYIIGNNPSINLNYLKTPEYQEQLKNRFKGTHFIYNDTLRLCKRVKEDEINNYLNSGWYLGRKIYK